jgi:phosphonoacetaldehyde hydrolase
LEAVLLCSRASVAYSPSLSGNGVGLSLAELLALPELERRARIDRAGQSLEAAGAHLVIDSVADLPSALTEIERRIAAGRSPWS